MSPRTLHKSLWLVSLTVTLAHCSVEFFISQTYDQCSKDTNTLACLNNTDRGGLCAYAQDLNKLWCCPAPDPTCWTFGKNCNGGSSGAPGTGQISCSNEGAQWCCNKEYELCTQAKNQINVCETNFASGNANVSIAEANAVESSSSASASSSATPLSSVSSTSTTTPTTTSAPLPASANPSVSPSPSVSKSSSGLPPGAIAGIVVAVVLVLASILGFIICGRMIRARRRRNHEAQPIIPTNKIKMSEMGDHPTRPELDGRTMGGELPAQEVRHELL